MKQLKDINLEEIIPGEEDVSGYVKATRGISAHWQNDNLYFDMRNKDGYVCQGIYGKHAASYIGNTTGGTEWAMLNILEDSSVVSSAKKTIPYGMRLSPGYITTQAVLSTGRMADGRADLPVANGTVLLDTTLAASLTALPQQQLSAIAAALTPYLK